MAALKGVQIPLINDVELTSQLRTKEEEERIDRAMAAAKKRKQEEMSKGVG